MEPVIPTRRALRQLGRRRGDDLEGELRAMAADVVRLAPSCLGLSLTLACDTLTFTLLADRQPLPDRPAAGQPEPVAGSARPLDEQRWRLLALADAAPGVASSLSLPVLSHESVVAEVVLYGATAETFTGRHDALAQVCGACAEAAVTDADLSFETLSQAAGTPSRLEALAVVDRATGYVAASQHVSTHVARRRLAHAARLTGVAEADLARAILGDGRG